MKWLRWQTLQGKRSAGLRLALRLLGVVILLTVSVLIGNVYLILLLAVLLLDYVYLDKSHRAAASDVEWTQAELETKTVELNRAHQELADHDREQRRARRSLRMLEKAVETMSLGVTISDIDGKILYVNPADARIHGYEVEELIGRNASLYSPVGSPPAEDSDSIFLHPWARERTNVTSDGRIFPVRLVSDMVRDDNGQPIGLVTICEDISERKRIETALVRRDRILEAVGIAAERFLVDSSWETSIEEVLESLKRATRVDRIDLVQVEDPRILRRGLDDTWTAFEDGGAPESPEQDLPAHWEEELRKGRFVQGQVQGRVQDLPPADRRAMEERGVQSFAIVPVFASGVWLGYLRLETSDGDREWSTVELEVLRTAARTLGAAIHRKQAEAALASSQAKYQDLLESASDLIQSVGTSGHFQFVNRAWEDALGYRQSEIDQLTLWDVVRPDHHKQTAEILERVLAGQPVERFEVVFVTKTGDEIYLEGNLNCRFIDGRPVATRGIFRDISERKVVDRMKNEFISTVSHELRTPLTSIIASLGLLQSGRLDGNPDRVEELVTVAHRNSNRLLHLINDLLDLQKLAARKIVYNLRETEVEPLLQEAVKGIQAFADSQGIRLAVGEVPRDAKILVDRDRLIQVLNNLLSNAIKFSPKGEDVRLEVRVEEEVLVISVTDRGPGIPEEFRERLFEQFTQGDQSVTRAVGGSGLGLSIVKGLVDGMGGRVFLDTRVGSGTTFHVEFSVTA